MAENLRNNQEEEKTLIESLGELTKQELEAARDIFLKQYNEAEEMLLAIAREEDKRSNTPLSWD